MTEDDARQEVTEYWMRKSTEALPAFLTRIAGAGAGFVFVGAALERKA